MSSIDIAAGTPTEAAAPTRRPGLLRALVRKPSGLAGLVIILGLIAAAVLAPLVATHDPIAQSLSNAYQAPSWLGGQGGLLGTDNAGRDVFSRIVYGSRISLMVGLVAATVSAVLGTLLGLVAGWKEGFWGTAIMRLADVQFALPFLVICLALVAVYGPGIEKVIILLSLWGWAIYARTMMATVQQVKQRDFVAAARLGGARTPRLLARHVLPNVYGPIIVLWSSAAGGLILAESALSLLGLGVQAPDFTWGSMLASGPVHMRTAWWMTVFPAMALMLAIVGFNLLGDALRDVLNPQLTQEPTSPALD